MAEEPASNPTLRRWHVIPDHTASGLGSASYSSRVFRLLAVIMALAGALLAWFLLFQRFHPPLLRTLPVNQYPVDWPVNPLTNADSNLLIDRFSDDPNRQKTYSSQSKTELEREFKDLQKAAAKHGVVVHLCANARTRQGQVFILPAKDPELDTNWVSLGEILQWFRDCSTQEKLLILDLRPVGDPRLGILATDVADRLEAALKQREAEQSLPGSVLCACAGGQHSLVSEDLGQSVFGFYLNEGLCGYADGYNPGAKHNGRVSVLELVDFLRARVDRWAVANREARQTPFLVGHTKDFDLVSPPHGDPLPAPTPSPLGDLPAFVMKGWELRDRWLENQTYRRIPGAFRRLETTLLRAERRWRAGLPGQAALEEEILKLKDEANNTKDQFEPRTFSLVKAAAQAEVKKPADRAEDKKPPDPAGAKKSSPTVGIVVDQETVNELLGLLRELQDQDPKTLGEKIKAKMKEKPFKELLKKDPLERGLIVWKTAADEVSTLRLDKRAELLKKLQLLPSRPAYSETAFLLRLAEWKREEKEAPDAAFRNALRAVEEELAALACDPRVFRWVEKDFDNATRKRSEGEKFLFGKGSIASAEKSLEEALLDFQNLNRAYIATLEQAYVTLDRAMALLPGYASYLMHRLDTERSDRLEGEWREAVQALQKLHQTLAQPGGRDQIDQAQNQAAKMNALLEDLRAPVKWSDQRAEQIEATPRDWGQLDSLLESSWPKAVHRQAIWRKKREIAQRLGDHTRERDEKENVAKVQTPAPKPLDSSATGPSERDRAVARARIAIDLLELGGLPGLENLKDLAQRASQEPLEAVLWTKLEDALKDACVKRGPAKIKEWLRQGEWAAADRLSRTLNPLDLTGPWVSALAKDNPATRCRREAAAHMRKSLAEYFQRLGENPDDPFRGFYRDVADEYLREIR